VPPRGRDRSERQLHTPERALKRLSIGQLPIPFWRLRRDSCPIK
jgi:hypothetical protein